MNTTLQTLLGYGAGLSHVHRYRLMEPLNADSARYLRCKAFDEARRVAVHLDIIPKHDRFDLAYRREFHALRNLSHPSILKALDFFEDEKSVVMATELTDGQRLSPSSLSPATKLQFLAKLARVVAYACSAGVRHLDLQPDRIVLLSQVESEDPELVVRGFNFAPDSGWGRCGDDRWTCVKHASYSQYDDFAGEGESYSLGVIAFELFTGVLPFYSDDEAALKFMHRSIAAPRLHELCEVPAWLSSLVASCLSKNSLERPSIDALARCLSGQSAFAAVRSSPRSVASDIRGIYRDYINELEPQNKGRIEKRQMAATG